MREMNMMTICQYLQRVSLVLLSEDCEEFVKELFLTGEILVVFDLTQLLFES
jgi:hypothetical protein